MILRTFSPPTDRSVRMIENFLHRNVSWNDVMDKQCTIGTAEVSIVQRRSNKRDPLPEKIVRCPLPLYCDCVTQPHRRETSIRLSFVWLDVQRPKGLAVQAMLILRSYEAQLWSCTSMPQGPAPQHGPQLHLESHKNCIICRKIK